MAVTTTVQQVLDSAYAKSTKNQPGTIANESTELYNVVVRSLRGLYAFAAEINPAHFSDTSDVVGASSAWERPESAEAIIRIEESDGTEVAVVPIDDRLAADPVPSLYEWGGLFKAVTSGQNPPGATDTLTFWFSKRPDDPDPTTLSGVLDADWQEDFNELLILEVAIYLALKDGRFGELEALKVERNSWAQKFAKYLQHATSNLTRRYGHRRYVNVESLLPMLTGGA